MKTSAIGAEHTKSHEATCCLSHHDDLESQQSTALQHQVRPQLLGVRWTGLIFDSFPYHCRVTFCPHAVHYTRFWLGTEEHFTFFTRISKCVSTSVISSSTLSSITSRFDSSCDQPNATLCWKRDGRRAATDGQPYVVAAARNEEADAKAERRLQVHMWARALQSHATPYYRYQKIER